MTTFIPRAPTRPPGIAIIVTMITLAAIDGLNLSTGGLDNTVFSMCKDGSDYVFTFSVTDETPCSLPQTSSKRDLEWEDRVELYFSPTADLSKPYYCAEIDPLGRVLDYRAAYYRDFDYSWGFTTLRTTHARTATGYRIECRIARAELDSLGIPETSFHMGVFRADLDESGNLVAWGSMAPMNDPPDFHRPCMFSQIKMPS